MCGIFCSIRKHNQQSENDQVRIELFFIFLFSIIRYINYNLLKHLNKVCVLYVVKIITLDRTVVAFHKRSTEANYSLSPIISTIEFR